MMLSSLVSLAPMVLRQHPLPSIYNAPFYTRPVMGHTGYHSLMHCPPDCTRPWPTNADVKGEFTPDHRPVNCQALKACPEAKRHVKPQDEVYGQAANACGNSYVNHVKNIYRTPVSGFIAALIHVYQAGKRRPS